MPPIILAPGPTKVHPELMQWMNDADAEGVFWRSHRTPWFESMFAEVKQGLRSLLSIPEGHTIALLTSANEAWERSIESLVKQESFHLVGGEFGERWFQYAKRLGRTPSRWEYVTTFSGNFGEVIVPESAEAICVTQNETSTGLWIPENQISQIANRYPNKLMLVDVVSSIPVVQLEWEKVDLTYWSVQKGFQLPAGLAVVVMSPRAIQRCQALTSQQSCGAYHSLSQLAANSEKNITAETPNVLAIYLLKRAIQKYLSSGLETIRTETLTRATSFYEQLNDTPFRALVTSKEFQSPTVFAVVSDADISTWRANLTSQQQIYTGACYSELKPHAFRIANFPIHTEEEHSAILNQMKLFTA